VNLVTPTAARRARDYVRVAGPDAEDFLQRMVSNDVAVLGQGDSCDALLLTAKARVIAPLRIWRRAADDFLLLTEPALGPTVRAQLLRSRFASQCEVELEEHASTVVLGDGAAGIPTPDYGTQAVEVLDDDGDVELDEEDLEPLRIRAGTPRFGREIDDRVLPAEAGLVERAVSLTKGCYPGQEPIARLHSRGHVNRRLRVLWIDGKELPPYDAEIRHGDRGVGRVTSAARADDGIVALGYVRVNVGDDAELYVGSARARLH
jgi:folate-binding protein YgfZ